ncbi:MAG: hypothetical protein KDA84_22430 [Planctomycetaceae bacterium]|nr:hypothetical protein [Planctomycetaceae bacterium]
MLLKLFDQQHVYFQEDPQRIDAYLKVGDSPFNAELDKGQLAVVASVVNALMNFDEAMMKR